MESGGGDGEKRLSRWDDGDDTKGAIIRARRAPPARAVVILSEHKYWDKLHSS